MSKVTALLTIVLLLFFTVTYASRPEPTLASDFAGKLQSEVTHFHSSSSDTIFFHKKKEKIWSHVFIWLWFLFCIGCGSSEERRDSGWKLQRSGRHGWMLEEENHGCWYRLHIFCGPLNVFVTPYFIKLLPKNECHHPYLVIILVMK